MKIFSNKESRCITPSLNLFNLPPALYAIFFIEFCERFAFFGLQAIAVLFFIHKLNLNEFLSTGLYCSFSALFYSTLVIGAYSSDKILGLRKTYLLGIIFLIIGYSILSLSSSVNALFSALGIILLGGSFFRSNAGNYITRCIENKHNNIYSVFTYFYMLINLGGLLGAILLPLIVSNSSYTIGIITCAIMMGLALGCYFLAYKDFIEYDNQIIISEKHPQLSLIVVIFLGVSLAIFMGKLLKYQILSDIVFFIMVFFSYFIIFFQRYTFNEQEKKGLMIGLILLVQSIGFWVLFMQIPTSLTLFVLHNVRHVVFRFNIQPGVTQGFNPFFIIILSPLLANIYRNKNTAPLSIPKGYAYGMLSCGLAYFILAFGSFFSDENAKISILWVFISYGLYSLGELLISVIGLSALIKFFPKRLCSFAQAIWYITVGFGLKIGGYLANIVNNNHEVISDKIYLSKYQHLFLLIGLFACILSIVFFVCSKPISNRINSFVNG